VLRRQRLHAERCVPERRVRRDESRHLQRAGSMPRRRQLQSGDRSLLEPREGERQRLHRRRSLHADRHVSGRNLRRRRTRHLHRARSVPRRRHVQSRHRRLYKSTQAERRRVQRRQRVHDRRRVPGRRVLPEARRSRVAALDQCHLAGT
jgi:hypothetical protein